MPWFPHLANGHDMINLTSWVAGVLHNTPRAPGTVSDAQWVLSSISGHLSWDCPLHQLLSAYPCSLKAKVNASTSPSGVRGDWAQRDFTPARGKPCRNPESLGENELDSHAARAGPTAQGETRRELERASERRGERTAGQLAGAALGPASGRPRTCPGAPGPSSLPQPVPALAARTRSSAGYSSAAASISSLSRRCGGVAPWWRNGGGGREWRAQPTAGQFRAGKGWGPTLRVTRASCTAGGGIWG